MNSLYMLRMPRDDKDISEEWTVCHCNIYFSLEYVISKKQ